MQQPSKVWNMACASRAFALCIVTASAAPIGAQGSRANESGPGPRKGHALVYNEVLRRVILVDASPRGDSLPRRQEVWHWDGAHWGRSVPDGDAPAGHTTGAVVFDTQRGVTVMYGGRTGRMTQDDVVGDTWEWNNARWQLRSNTTIGARDHIAMAYDRRRGRAVLFGGTVFPRMTGPWATDTWEWDGSTWSRVAADGPTGRITAMAYDQRRGEVVLFGGHGDGQPATYFGDTWLWNGTSWRLGPGGPVERSGHAMAYDEARGVVLMFGGGTREGGGSYRELDDMWQWNGVEWRSVATAGPTPGARTGHAMAFDAARGRVVLHGGSRGPTLLADTWEWDGQQWRECTSSSPCT